MDREKLLDDIASTQRHFVMTLRGFPAGKFNTKPAADVWSAGEVAEHVALAEEFFLPVLTGPGRATPGCDLDKRIDILRAILGDRDKKYAAPQRVWPSSDPKDVETLVARLSTSRGSVTEAARSLDLTETATAFAHPVFGEMTRAEWIYAIVLHGERHRGQIEGLKSRV